MTELINPSLYRRLCRVFDTDVQVLDPGMAIRWRVTCPPVMPGQQRRLQRQIDAYGEGYQVNCPFCRDQRKRLRINHQWGVRDPETGSDNLWLAKCFNEDCFSDRDGQKHLFDFVWSTNPRKQRSSDLQPGRVAEAREVKEVSWPGPVIRMDEMARRYPTHKSVHYLQGRGFDPVKIGKLWGAGYCTRSSLRHAADRIVIPIHQDGMMVGWQARYIGDKVDGSPFNLAKVPKYFTSPGMPTSLVAYNLERALRHRTVVIVEGTTDVWNVGPMALALLGKTLSGPICERIATTAKQTGAVVIMALDPKPDNKDARRGKPHPITVAGHRLQEVLGRRVVPLFLPMQYDPGSIDRSLFRKLAIEAAREHGFTADFTKRALLPASSPGAAK